MISTSVGQKNKGGKAEIRTDGMENDAGFHDQNADGLGPEPGAAAGGMGHLMAHDPLANKLDQKRQKEPGHDDGGRCAFEPEGP